MFIEKQEQSKQEYYAKMLGAIGSLSRLFSESDEPYLAYRVAENLFCKAFQAMNLSRGDTSADASKDKIGFGIKTFLEGNGRTFQKIAEFNSDQALFIRLPTEEKIKRIAELRNERISATKRIAGLDNIIYHCVTRESGRIMVYEEPMLPIEIPKIEKIEDSDSSISFRDPNEEYSFYVSKSTLYKRFVTRSLLLNVRVKILDDPFAILEGILPKPETKPLFEKAKEPDSVFLPLYSTRGGSKNVPESSGLNQWNASGRPRDPNEVYVPIPAWIHSKFPNFFPPRDEPFSLRLPSGEVLSAKVCQDGSKALMTNPNSALGKWLLRDVLNLKERELLTYDRLQIIGLDTVVINKTSDHDFEINFTQIGSFEEFENNFKD